MKKRVKVVPKKVNNIKKKKSNTIWIYIGLIVIIAVLLVVIFIAINNKSPGNGDSSVSDNLGKLIDASKTCKESNIKYINKISLFGIEQTTVTYFEIKGLKEDKCELYIRSDKITIELSDEFQRSYLSSGGTQAELDQLIIETNREGDALEGKDGTCSFDVSYLTNLLEEWNVGTFSNDYVEEGNCQGTMFEPIMMGPSPYVGG